MTTSVRSKAYLIAAIAIVGGMLLACGEPNWGPTNPPWKTQPLSLDTKEYFCTKFAGTSTQAVCQDGKEVYAKDLVPIIEQRFPENQTPYSEVAEVLQGYPFSIDESKLPDGTVTSRTYEYLLTEFDGFCIRFSIRDLQSEIVSRVYTVWNDTCGPARGHPGLTRPWFSKPTPERSPAP
jgi:hypothetical protein